MNNTYIAVDFGASNGRVIAGTLVNGIVEMQELHRFPNKPVKLDELWYWNFLSLFDEMKTGLRIAGQQGLKLNGIGIDTWGVDYGFISRHGELFGNPDSYRNYPNRSWEYMLEGIVDPREHYKRTGIQPMAINTLFRIMDVSVDYRCLRYENYNLMFMPDLFSYFLCGGNSVEYTIASTSELVNAHTRKWEKKLIDKLDIPSNLFLDIIDPGTVRGRLFEDVAEELGLPRIDVIAVGSHDTASAVVAVPTTEPTAAFLSSGTWSLLGTVLNKPITSAAARRAGFSNEGGVGGKIRFLQNIPGLWILQRLMAEWSGKDGELSYDEILAEAKESTNKSIIFVDDSAFQNPEKMEVAIIRHCKNNEQPVPETRADMVKCVLQSLALRYKQGIEQMNKLLSQPITQLHIIGGGSRNSLLNQLTANATGLPVYAGPVEATAMGNILVQAWAKGEIDTFEELKATVIRSVKTEIYYPE